MPTTSLILPVYEAGEQPIEGVTSEALVSPSAPAAIATPAISTAQDAIAPFVRERRAARAISCCARCRIDHLWANALPDELAGSDAA